MRFFGPGHPDRVWTDAPAWILEFRRLLLRLQRTKRQGWLIAVGNWLGFHQWSGGRLVSIVDAFAHARLPTLWLTSSRAPFNEPLTARGFGGDAFFGPVANDGGTLAQRAGGGFVRRASPTRRVGRLGSGAPGRFQWTVFHAHPRGLCRVCPSAAIARALSRRGRVPHVGPPGQINTGDGSTASALARLLAIGAVSPNAAECPAGTVSLAGRRGEADTFCLGHRRRRRDHAAPTARPHSTP